MGQLVEGNQEATLPHFPLPSTTNYSAIKGLNLHRASYPAKEMASLTSYIISVTIGLYDVYPICHSYVLLVVLNCSTIVIPMTEERNLYISVTHSPAFGNNCRISYIVVNPAEVANAIRNT